MKKRLDDLLVTNGYYADLNMAQALIMAGRIMVNERKITKAGQLVDECATIRVLGDQNPFVGRGGLKLQKALQVFAVDPRGKVCLDIGASTGGFTDCLLQCGASKVFAIDVGHGQLDWKLQNDPRVKIYDKTNIRYLTVEKLYGSSVATRASIATVDVSFISLTQVLPSLQQLLAPAISEVIALVKPQFEAPRDAVPKGGVIRDAKIHIEVLGKVKKAAEDLGFVVLGETDSPITGTDGNKEFFIWLKN